MHNLSVLVSREENVGCDGALAMPDRAHAWTSGGSDLDNNADLVASTSRFANRRMFCLCFNLFRDPYGRGESDTIFVAMIIKRCFLVQKP